MIHGYATLAINLDGTTAHVFDRKCHDARMEHNIEWGDIPLHELLIPVDTADCLAMVFFSYESIPSFNGESTDYDDDVVIENFVIMQPRFKEFWRSQISLMVTYDGKTHFPRELDDEEFTLDPNYHGDAQKEDLSSDIFT